MAMRIRGSMTEGPLFWNIILYTIPIILTSVLQLLFNAADLVIVGRFCGSISVGAVGATGSLTTLLINFFIGLSVGTGVATAQSIGAGERERVHRTVHTAIPLALCCGVLLTFVGVFFSEPILKLMSTPKNVLPLSALYMKIFFSGTVFNLVYNFAASILRAAGDTKSPLVFLSIAGVVNVILNIIFVTAFDMNVAGVALATVISQAISAVLTVLALMKREDATQFFVRKMRFCKDCVSRILKVGVPAGIQSSLFAISNVLIQSSVNSFGEVFVSGASAAGNIEGFQYVMMNSFYQSALNFTGQNVGAKRYDRVKKIFRICLASVAVVGIVTGVLEVLFGKSLLSIYITDSTQAIEYGMVRLVCIGLAYFLCGMMEVTTGMLRGMGASMQPMIISIIGVCILRVAWVYTIFQIPAFHTPEGLFFSYPVSWIITFLAQFVAYKIVYKRRARDIKEQEC